MLLSFLIRRSTGAKYLKSYFGSVAVSGGGGRACSWSSCWGSSWVGWVDVVVVVVVGLVVLVCSWAGFISALVLGLGGWGASMAVEVLVVSIVSCFPWLEVKASIARFLVKSLSFGSRSVE